MGVLYFVFAWMFLLSAAQAQANGTEVEFLHQMWRSEDGLPGPVVKAITQTKAGYLLLATDEGLTRFDGVRFKSVEPPAPANKTEKWLMAVTETKDGSTWASSILGGLSRFRGDTVTTYTTNNGLPSNYILSLYEDLQGSLWIGTSHGLSRFKDEKFINYTNEPGLLVEAVRSILEDRQGNLWVGTARGLSCHRGGVFTSYTSTNLLVSDAVMTLWESRDGALWVGTSGGLTRVVNGKPTHFTMNEGLAHNIVRDVMEDSSGELWIATQGGIQVFRNGKFLKVKLHDGYPDFEGISFAYTLHQDREGSIWVGSNLGISRLKPQQFRLYTAEEGLGCNLTTLVFEDAQSVVWIGTYGGGLARIENGKLTKFTTENGLPSDYILALWQDKQGVMWIGTEGSGLVKYQNGQFVAYRAESLPANIVRVIYEDQKGRFWVGGNAGVHRFVDGQLIKEPNLGHSTTKAIYEDRQGDVWFGSKSGLVQWRDEFHKAYNNQTSGLPTTAITAVFQDSNTNLWVATEAGGINLLKEDGNFAPTHPNFNEKVLHILEDDYQLWLGCRSGIFCASKRQLQLYAAGKLERVEFLSYGRKDGLRRAQVNGIAQPAGWKGRDGQMWFPTMHGAVSFNPANLTSNRLPPPVVIEEILVDEKPVAMKNGMKFPPGRGEVEIQFTALSFQAPEKIQFKYKLDGSDSHWEDAGGRRVARYASLPPGNYTFQVKACNNDGIWNEAGESFTFTLTPHFYETYTFYGACAVTLIASGFGVQRFRIRRMRKREAELAELVEKRTSNLQEMIKSMENVNYSIAHDLRAPIRAIRGFTEALIEDYRPSLDTAGCEYANRIEESVDRMDRLIQDLLTYGQVSHKEIPMERVNIHILLTKTVQMLNQEIVARKAVVEMRMPMPDAWANSSILEQVFVNLITNGMKFVTPNLTPRLELWADETSSRIRVYVRDNGIGIKPEHHERVFRIFERLHNTETYPGTGIGLAIVHRGVERMGGKVTITSKEGEGSCFCVELMKPKKV